MPSGIVIVSNGIGTIFPPVRFFAPPQIVQITLESGPAASSSFLPAGPYADLQL